MSKQRTLPGMNESTCLAESVAGNLPCTLPGGLPIGQPGPAVVPVSRTQQRASKKVKRTKGTFGQKCSGSSASVALQSSLVSRLKPRLDSVGSMEYSQTWRAKATPAGRSYWAHTASARRTSDSESTGWPTPTAQNAQGGPATTVDPGNHFTLQTAALLTGWPTPQACDGPNNGTNRGNGQRRARNTPQNVPDLVGWPSPTASDTTGGKIPLGHANRSNITKLKQVSSIVGWATPTAQDHSRGGRPPRSTDTGVPLSQMAALAGWVSPSSLDWKDSPGMATVGVNPDGSLRNRVDQLPRQAQLVDGITTTSSTAETEKRGALNPAHSRWLQGYPISWCEAAILAHRLMPRQRQRHAKCG